MTATDHAARRPGPEPEPAPEHKHRDLLARIWPLTARAVADGGISVGGVTLAAIAARYGTPAYVLDEDDFRQRCREYRQALPDAEIAYAGKAFLCRAMDAKDECHLLFVPVRESGSDVLALRTGRLPSGQRVGLAYTSAATLLAALGPGQSWIRLHEDAMRDMLEPAGIDQIRVDACPSAPPGTTAAAARLRRGSHPPRPPLVRLTHQRPTTAMSHCRGQNHHAVTLPWLRPEASGSPVDQSRLCLRFRA